MTVEEVWELPVNLPMKVSDGHYGRIIKTDMQTEMFHVEVFDKDTSLGVRTIPFAMVDRLRPRCNALVELN